MTVPMHPQKVIAEKSEDHAAPVAECSEGDAADARAGQREEKKSQVQIFQMTISLRDDWLHRGDALQDMDLQTYAEHVERQQKPVLGADMKRMLQRNIFAFDAHYKLAATYMQVLKPAKHRCIARFNMPNCLRENVNEGEENALFKAFHCSLLRCPGPGSCAEPLQCANVMFPGQDGRYRFRPAWRARESEIITLAQRGQEKKMQARRLETLHDTSLCKTWQISRELADENGATEHMHDICQAFDADSEEVRVASRILQIDLQRLFRQRIRTLREDSPAERPCVYGYRAACLAGRCANHPARRRMIVEEEEQESTLSGPVSKGYRQVG